MTGILRREGFETVEEGTESWIESRQDKARKDELLT